MIRRSGSDAANIMLAITTIESAFVHDIRDRQKSRINGKVAPHDSPAKIKGAPPQNSFPDHLLYGHKSGQVASEQMARSPPRPMPKRQDPQCQSNGEISMVAFISPLKVLTGKPRDGTCV